MRKIRGVDWRITYPIHAKSFSAFFERLRKIPSREWRRRQDLYIRNLHTQTLKRAPAYAQFVSSQKSTTADGIPFMTKDSYTRKYPFKKLLAGILPHTLTSTSGSTGTPTYFARLPAVDDNASLLHEIFFRTTSLSHDVPTLVVVCFGMGVWIGGTITYQAFEKMGRRGYPVAIITPGINKTEIMKALAALSSSYEQLILVGYPPFVKDVIDETREKKIRLPSRVALLFAAEAFPEAFRDHLAEKAGVRNLLTDTANIYGTAELGTMAIETPLSILIRRIALKRPRLFKSLFGDASRVPTFAQYVPTCTSFETERGEVYLSGDSAIPLVRYAIGDRGGVLEYDRVDDICRFHGVDLSREAKRANISRTVTKLPFVFVYERVDLSTTLYGLQIYPQTIREVILKKPFASTLTGRFVLSTTFDKKSNQHLEVNMELARGKRVPIAMKRKIADAIVRHLIAKNSEYRELERHLGGRATPKVIFSPYEDPRFFKRDGKQQWVRRHP